MRQPPAGTVTFLFTDIQGSTRLWEQHPDAMRPALARHDHLLHQAIADNNGYVFKTVGDAFCAAFATAPDAVQAALSAQQAMEAQSWDLPAPLLVRIALHTGAAEERGGDYFGQSLNRVARLMAAGHGGQTLLSGAAQELTRDHLPKGMTLLDLGERRLKDLGRPEHVFQLRHPSLPADFPPLRSLDNPDLPNNLPQQVTSFIGREKQVEDVTGLLGKTRLLTLTGAGGSGKTRLSLQVAADLLDQYFDGVWLVELAALSDPDLVPQAVIAALRLREEPDKPIQQTLVEWLRPKCLLLILDNCEHLVVACASLAADILRHCPDVRLMASSREPLNLAGEQTYRVPSLSLPDPKKAQTAEGLSQYEAVRLFIERAQAVQPSFSVTDANAPAVAQVCFRLDGVPLAIELAAARVRSLSAEEINRRLDQRFRLLTGGSRDTLPRQQTLRALIDWSYDLLTEAEKALLCRLSVFAGGWILSAAEAVCAGEPVEDWEVLDLLTALVDKSLVAAEPLGDGTRYRLLETVHQYAGERLGQSGEAVVARHAAWALALAEEAEPHLTGPEQGAWLSLLEAEHDNLRASLSWSLSYGGPQQGEQSNDDGLRLAGALWRFWSVRGHLSEGRRWLDQALARAGASGGEASAARAKALQGAVTLARRQGDYAGSQELCEESLALSRQLGDQHGIAKSLYDMGQVAYTQDDFAGARALFEESLTLFRQLGDQEGVANALRGLGLVVHSQGDFAGARALCEESLALSRQSGDPRAISNALMNLGQVAQSQGDFAGARALYEESLILTRQLGGNTAYELGSLGQVAQSQGDFAGARVLFEESLTIWRQLGNQHAIAHLLNNLGQVAQSQGDLVGARAWYEESLTLFRQLRNQKGIAMALCNLGETSSAQGDSVGALALLKESVTLSWQLGNQKGIAYGLGGLGIVARRQSQMGRATRLIGAAASLRESIGTTLTPVEQAEVDMAVASAAEALGEATFTSAWDAGRAMTLDEAVEYALSEE